MTRVLFISAERVGETMAGPAIRTLELARTLSRHCEVTIAAPGPSDVGDAPVELLDTGLLEFEPLLAAVRRHDVVVAQRLPPQLLMYVARLPIRLVADLYNPQMIEVLEAGGDRSSWRRSRRSVLGQLAVADLVVCASEKQRDLWLGAMAVEGLVDPDRYRADPTFRRYVDVVPFGVPERGPAASEPAMKGVWAGIEPEDRVLLWGGGIWRWLDALTPIRALERLRAEGRRVHLVFLGTERPAVQASGVPTTADQAIAFARERGLEGDGVHFNRGWVPYSERGAFLQEADIGVSAHPDHLEARFSFRTRVLDHLWAGLPSVVSRGDAVGEAVEREGLGHTAAPGDDAGFAAACARLLDDDAAHAAVSERALGAARSLRWSEVARPLVEFCLHHDELPRRRPSRALLGRATLSQYPDVLRAVRRDRGLGELARRVPRHVGRAVRHRP